MIHDNNKRSKIRIKRHLSTNKTQKISQVVDNFHQLEKSKIYQYIFTLLLRLILFDK